MGDTVAPVVGRKYQTRGGKEIQIFAEFMHKKAKANMILSAISAPSSYTVTSGRRNRNTIRLTGSIEVARIGYGKFLY